MKYFIALLITLIVIDSSVKLIAQEVKKDKGTFVESKNIFFEGVEASLDSFYNGNTETDIIFQMDFEGYNLPDSKSNFTTYWHNDPISQAKTSTCWAFSTTSFFESEIYRLFNKKVKLSEMWTAYWEFVEKARGFVNSRGEWLFTAGSESNAVNRIWEEYGVVPAEIYTGLKPGQKYLNTSEMYDEMKDYLIYVKKHNLWNEEVVVGTIKSIMDHWIGTPPESFEYEGKVITPKQYLEEYVDLNLDDYVEVLSLMQEPYYEFVEYKVPDNWWHNKDYFNLPLKDFMNIVKRGIREGYTICIGGDVSESGKNPELDVFVVPSYDIPSEYIDESARQFRFSNKTTTDDHGVHLVGYTELEGDDWYLIKDSGSSSRNGNLVGYYIFSEDYVKLKMLSFTIHKDMVRDYLIKSEN